MSPLLVVWLLVSAGALLASRYVVCVFRAGLNVEAFAKVVGRLLHEGNADRALKLCGTVPDSPIATATRAAIDACSHPLIQSDPASDYRSAGDLSTSHVLAPIRAAFDGAFAELARPIRGARLVALPGAALLAAALALAVAAGPVAGPAVGAAAAFVVVAWAGWSERGIIASRDATFAALSGAFEAFVHTPGRR